MIKYTLTCDKAHDFDSWFQSAAAFDGLSAAGQLACPVCGSTTVAKKPMAPALRPDRKNPARPALTEPQSDVEAALAELRQQIEANSEYVGMNFAAEARRMHEGEIDRRSIYGEARQDEARALLEDGIPVAPLPFLPKRQAN